MYHTRCIPNRSSEGVVQRHAWKRIPLALVFAMGSASAAVPEIPDITGKVVDALWSSVEEEPFRVVPTRQVVVGAARDEDVMPVGLESFDEV